MVLCFNLLVVWICNPGSQVSKLFSHLLSRPKPGNKGVSQLSGRLLLCAHQGGFVQFMYAASLALFRDIHSQMFLGLPFFFFVVEAKRGSDVHVKKKGGRI